MKGVDIGSSVVYDTNSRESKLCIGYDFVPHRAHVIPVQSHKATLDSTGRMAGYFTMAIVGRSRVGVGLDTNIADVTNLKFGCGILSD